MALNAKPSAQDQMNYGNGAFQHQLPMQLMLLILQRQETVQSL
jgi:hypothetical protein